MAADQQLLAAWVSAGAAAVQAIGAIGAIIVAIKLARDSERRAIKSERAAVEREIAAERAATARAEAADRAAEARVQRSIKDQRRGMVETIVTLAREVLEEADQKVGMAEKQYGGPEFRGVVSGGYTSKQARALAQLIPDWKLAARDAALLKAISRLERAIKPWDTPSGGLSGSSYVSTFKAHNAEIRAAIEEIDGFSVDKSEPAVE